MSDADKFDVKMVILRHVRTGLNSLFELIPDDENQPLDELVVSSLRGRFKISENKDRFSLECKESEIMLLKLLKSLKLNEWKAVTSNAFSNQGTPGSVETLFYYEKALSQTQAAPAAAVNQPSKFAFKRPVSQPTHTDTHSHTVQHYNVHATAPKPAPGNEEEKSSNAYTSKPLPSVPAVQQKVSAIQAAVSNIEDKEKDGANHPNSSHDLLDGSKRASTNREKLLQKYNQHRRASISKPAVAEATDSHPLGNPVPAAASETATMESSRASVNMSKPPTHVPPPPSVSPSAPSSTSSSAAAVAPAVGASSSGSAASSSSSSAGGNTSSSSAASATQPAAAVEAPPRVNAASAYPALVRRISSKGFMQVDPAAKQAVDGGPAGIAEASSNITTSNSSHSSHSNAAPPPPSAGVQTSAAAVSGRPVPQPPPMPPVAPPAVPPPAAPIVALPRAVETEGGDDGDGPDQYIPKIASSNPLSSPNLQKFASMKGATIGTPDNDPHEASRTNHYSKLGSAFFNGSNALGPGARRGGAGRGLSGFSSMSSMK